MAHDTNKEDLLARRDSRRHSHKCCSIFPVIDTSIFNSSRTFQQLSSPTPHHSTYHSQPTYYPPPAFWGTTT